MWKFIAICLIVLVFLVAASNAQIPVNNTVKPKVGMSVAFGSKDGFGSELACNVSNLASGFPFDLRFGIGYAYVQAGDPAAARRVFINDATNGVPEKNGRKWDYKLDLVYPMKGFLLGNTSLYGGPRYSRFTANFSYVGGNEDFDVRSNQWGLGGGLESAFAITPKFDLMVTTGVDYLPSAELKGHDTSYSPDGETGKERDDYTFTDADDAIDQPEVELRLLIGLKYNF